MTPPNESLILYDLASTLQPPQWSPHTLRTRLLLNHLAIPFRTQFLSYPDIAPTLAALGVEETEPAAGWGRGPGWTVPVLVVVGGEEGKKEVLKGTWAILAWVEKTYGGGKDGRKSMGDLDLAKAKALETRIFERVILPARAVIWPVLPRILDDRGAAYFRHSRQTWLGKPVDPPTEEEQERIWGELGTTFRGMRPSGGEPFLGGGGGDEGGPGYADFILVACLGWIKAVCPEDWARIMEGEGEGGAWLRTVWDACEKWMV
ncbi:hypothetical protein YB2330_006350 [Saitoella coloradoensis]